jgi:cell wall-associated NlpC family hydrolase
MSEPSYFDNQIAASKLRKEALSWIGTPFRELTGIDKDADLNDLKGPGGGIDCIGLVHQIFYRIEATHKWTFPRELSDYNYNDLGGRFLQWLRGEIDDPRSKMLAQILTELKVPDAVTEIDAECPRDFFKPGDVLVLKHASLYHMPVIYDNDLHFINALPRIGVVEGTIQDSTYSSHLVAVFRLKPKQ